MNTRIITAAVALSLGLVAGCKDNRSASDDSALARDLALAGQQPVQPVFRDTALAPAPDRAAPAPERPRPTPTRSVQPRQEQRREAPRRVASAPTPAPRAVEPDPSPAPAEAPAPAAGQIGAGVGFAVTSGGRVCTNSARPGDKIVATVDAPVTGTRGFTIPAGTTVVLEVTSVNADSPESASIGFKVRSIDIDEHPYTPSATVAVNGPLEKSKVAKDPNADRRKVVGGAVAGAVLGGIFGKSTKSTVIGAAAGAAAGTIAAKASDKYEACLPAGTPMRVTLDQALVMR